MKKQDGWFKTKFPQVQGEIAYFCAEFGVDPKLPVYSGGLGILAGDHLKEASDLGLPLVAVGLFYSEGYFKQQINKTGQQIALYTPNNPNDYPVHKINGPDGKALQIKVDLGDREVTLEAYEGKVGRIPLYLLTTDTPSNSQADRRITDRLYCIDRTQRLEQEILIGIGGWQLLQQLKRPIRYLHLNEGHCVFAALEWVRQTMQATKLDFKAASAHVKSKILFTLHTPVPAGNEVFDENLVSEKTPALARELGLSSKDFLALGRQRASSNEGFNLSALALKLAQNANGVSALHGQVSRAMWQGLYPGKSVEDVPIGSVTNGVHFSTWVAPSLIALYKEHLGPDFMDGLDSAPTWQMDKIPDARLWELHLQMKREMIDDLRQRHLDWLKRENLTLQTSPFLDPEALTIGFARRFAGYKRATLIFRDLSRLKALLGNSAKPLQIIFAGKSHPADQKGQALIQELVGLSLSKDFYGKVFLVEGYDIDLAKKLVQGVDIWLNNPIKPQEASGTSGQKAAINGVLNLSVLDGWWDEGCTDKNGWGIEEQEGDTDDQIADRIYSLLENEIGSLYFDKRSHGIPIQWVSRMKAAIASVTPRFTTRRMLKEYCEKYYGPGLAS